MMSITNNGRFELIILGEHLLSLIADLKNAGIKYEFGIRKQTSSFLYIQVVSVAENDMDAVIKILDNREYNCVY
jgi:hypothetical protein